MVHYGHFPLIGGQGLEKVKLVGGWPTCLIWRHTDKSAGFCIFSTVIYLFIYCTVIYSSYTYICTYVYMYIYVHTYVCVYIHTHIFYIWIQFQIVLYFRYAWRIMLQLIYINYLETNSFKLGFLNEDSLKRIKLYSVCFTVLYNKPLPVSMVFVSCNFGYILE